MNNQSTKLTKDELQELKTLAIRMKELLDRESVNSSHTKIWDDEHGLICETDVGYFDEGLSGIIENIKSN
jgi:hypothetical protein